jgi:hypothetical protein
MYIFYKIHLQWIYWTLFFIARCSTIFASELLESWHRFATNLDGSQDPDQGVVGFSHSFMNSLRPLSPKKLCVLELARATYLSCPWDHLPDPLHEFEVPWHKPCPMTLGNIYAWIWVFSVSTTGDGSTTALPICIEVEDQGWKACQNPEATQAIKGRWSTYMCAHFKHQTQEMIMFSHRLTSSF